jgi:hypothetical protein
MIKKNLNEFFRGWFIGNFEPSMLKTDDFEIGIKRYNKGDFETAHYHKEAIEYTVIVEGVVKMNDVIYKKDDIIEVAQWETIRFECLEDAVTVVIKTPCVKGDKYLA